MIEFEQSPRVLSYISMIVIHPRQRSGKMLYQDLSNEFEHELRDLHVKTVTTYVLRYVLMESLKATKTMLEVLQKQYAQKGESKSL